MKRANTRGAAARCLSAEMSAGGGADQARLRAWLEYVAETAIDMLDAMDAAMTDREPDELDEIVSEDDAPVRRRAA